MSNERVAVVLINYQRPADLLACLASLNAGTYKEFQVIVMDGGPDPAFAQTLSERFANVEVHRLPGNVGYAGSNNLGLRLALEKPVDWLFVLNEDTLVAPDCLSLLLAAGQANPQLGLLGPTIYHFDEPTVIQSSGGTLNRFGTPVHIGRNEPDQGQYAAPRLVDWLSGCALFIRRTVVEQIGVFDERLFMYWEDTDLCLRAGRAGWQLQVVPQAKLWHKGSQRQYRPQPYVTYYSTRNQFLVLRQNQLPLGMFVYQLLQTLRTLVSWSLRPKWQQQRVPHGQRDALWQGLKDYFAGRWGERAF